MNVDACSDSYREYDAMVANLAKNLMDIIIEGLEVNADLFAPYLNNNSSLLRWNHYPPCPQPHKSLGMSAHTDFNLLTVLHQGDIGGLQVVKNGKWIAVKPQKDALAINLGDTLQVRVTLKDINYFPFPFFHLLITLINFISSPKNIQDRSNQDNHLKSTQSNHTTPRQMRKHMYT